MKVNSLQFINLEKKRASLANDLELKKLANTYKLNINPVNLNSKNFWNQKIVNERQKILSSPIYIDKIKRVSKFLNNSSGSLLDVGVGYGDLEIKLKENRNLKLYGIDISDRAISQLSKKVNGNFKVGSINKIPFEAKSFDFVVALDILEHIPANEISSAYIEIKRVLKKDGYLIASVPLNEGLEEMLANNKNPNGHMRIYTNELFLNELKINGFRIVTNYLLFAFSKYYFIKNKIVNAFNFILNKDANLIIVFAQIK